MPTSSVPPLSSMMRKVSKIYTYGRVLLLPVGVSCLLLKVVVSLGCAVRLHCLGPPPLPGSPSLHCHWSSHNPLVCCAYLSVMFTAFSARCLAPCLNTVLFGAWMKTAMIFHASADVLDKQYIFCIVLFPCLLCSFRQIYLSISFLQRYVHWIQISKAD